MATEWLAVVILQKKQAHRLVSKDNNNFADEDIVVTTVKLNPKMLTFEVSESEKLIVSVATSLPQYPDGTAAVRARHGVVAKIF